MFVVGLTGTTGSGKGYVCSLMQQKGILTVDTDKVYHEMISAPSPCTAALVEVFGKTILNENNGINRKKLADIVFKDKDNLGVLNKITHMYILNECRNIIIKSSALGNWLTVIDAPLLFESGFDSECDKTVCVTANEKLRLERILKRDNITIEQALARIQNQKHDSFFVNKCDYIIFNDRDDVKVQVNELINELKRLYDEKKKKEE